MSMKRKVTRSPARKSPSNSDFNAALRAMISGYDVTKEEWDDPSVYCSLRDEKLMIHIDNEWHDWIISEGDLVGNDWVIHKKTPVPTLQDEEPVDE